MARISVDGDIVVNAPFDVVSKALQDIEGEQEWIKELKSVEVLERDDQGRVTAATLTVEIAKLGKDVYRNDYQYPGADMTYQTTGSSIQKEQFGAYRVRDNGDGTSTFIVEITVEAKVPAPGFVVKGITNTVMNATLKGFKEWVETTRV